MSGISAIYTEVVHDNLHPLYANWEPGAPLSLGDFGVLDEYCFRQLGNVGAFDIKTTLRKDPTADHKYFASEGSTEVSFFAKGSMAPKGGTFANATLEVGFSSSEAVFFSAADCTHDMIDDKEALGRSVKQLYDADKWDDDWVVITDLVSAKSAAIAVSASDSASITFEAAGAVQNIKLSDASIGLSIKSSTSVGYQLSATSGGVLLLGLCGLKSRFLGIGGKKWGPTSLSFGISTLRRAGPDVKLLNVSLEKRRLEFMQLD